MRANTESSEMAYSLWIMPDGAVADKLNKAIEVLSQEHSAPIFSPHVTVCHSFGGDEDEVIQKAQQLASSLQKYYVSFLDVSYGSIFYQCVYILCAKAPQTMAASAKAREAFGLEPAPYMPHLSLLYSDIDEGTRQQVVEKARAMLYGEGSGYDTLLPQAGFWANKISLWYTPNDHTLASWRKVAEFPLQ